MTPAIISAAQYTQPIDGECQSLLSPVELITEASRRALATAVPKDSSAALAQHIDTLMAVRTFEDSAPGFASPFGRATNMPTAIARRLGLSPTHLMWGTSGGDTPQTLVAEACMRIARGESRAVLVCGGEAIATARYLAKQGVSADWSDSTDAPVDDRGPDFSMLHPIELAHGLTTPALFHGLIENARRSAEGWSLSQWQREMGALMARFCAVAHKNPYSFEPPPQWSAEELTEATHQNRRIAHPYTQRMMAKDRVNQSAAVLVVADDLANEWAVPREQCVYLQGYAARGEPPVSMRPNVGFAPSAGEALQAALDSAQLSLNAIQMFDFYSCFPVAVHNAIRAVGLEATDSRGLTVTGGLPYFGGPGNNYSLHAIAETVCRLQRGEMSRALVAANGGFLSKYAVGIYGTAPNSQLWANGADAALRSAKVDDTSKETVTLASAPSGSGRIDTYTVEFQRDGSAKRAIVLGTLTTTDERFIACTEKGDAHLAAFLAQHEGVGRRVMVAPSDEPELVQSRTKLLGVEGATEIREDI